MIEGLIKLVDAGFSKAEILELMKSGTPEQKKEPEPEPKKEPQTEPKKEPDPLAELKAELVSLREEMHLTNINNSKQPENQRTVDDILREAMEGGKK